MCTADGVALGAAATTDQAGVEMIVFFAIMLHKVPYRIATCKPTNKTLRKHINPFIFMSHVLIDFI